MRAKFRNFVLILVLLFAFRVHAQGGPPLVTDDPGTLGSGHWEINAAGLWQDSSSENIYQAPYFDVNYGWGAHIQLKVETGYLTARAKGFASASGLAPILAGVKWRFVDEEASGLAISTYPQVQFNPSFSNREIASPGSHYFLPLEFSKTFGKFGVNPEVGYNQTDVEKSEWVYGVAASYEFQEGREALFEVHGRTRADWTEFEILFNVGMRYAFSQNLSLILAVGHAWRTMSGEEPFDLGYLGAQIRL